MTRLLIPLSIADISSFTKSLKVALDVRHANKPTPPSHVELLNLLAASAGLRNFQTLKAAAEATPAEPSNMPEASADVRSAPSSETLSALARKTLLQFDAAGRLVRLPNKLSVQRMAMWALWTHFVVRRKYTEKEVNHILNANHTFGDQATLRRELVNMKLLGRKPDCSVYWKEPQRPDAEVQAFLRAKRSGHLCAPAQHLK